MPVITPGEQRIAQVLDTLIPAGSRDPNATREKVLASTLSAILFPVNDWSWHTRIGAQLNPLVNGFPFRPSITPRYIDHSRLETMQSGRLTSMEVVIYRQAIVVGVLVKLGYTFQDDPNFRYSEEGETAFAKRVLDVKEDPYVRLDRLLVSLRDLDSKITRDRRGFLNLVYEVDIISETVCDVVRLNTLFIEKDVFPVLAKYRLLPADQIQNYSPKMAQFIKDFGDGKVDLSEVTNGDAYPWIQFENRDITADKRLLRELGYNEGSSTNSYGVFAEGLLNLSFVKALRDVQLRKKYVSEFERQLDTCRMGVLALASLNLMFRSAIPPEMLPFLDMISDVNDGRTGFTAGVPYRPIVGVNRILGIAPKETVIETWHDKNGNREYGKLTYIPKSK